MGGVEEVGTEESEGIEADGAKEGVECCGGRGGGAKADELLLGGPVGGAGPETVLFEEMPLGGGGVDLAVVFVELGSFLFIHFFNSGS